MEICLRSLDELIKYFHQNSSQNGQWLYIDICIMLLSIQLAIKTIAVTQSLDSVILTQILGTLKGLLLSVYAFEMYCIKT